MFSLAWNYLNKQSATIAVIKDYNKMKRIIEMTPERVKELHNYMESTRSAALSNCIGVRNPQSGEAILVQKLSEIDILEERYRQALDYMLWFESAWESLTDKEQMILQEFYMKGSQKSGANTRLQNEIGYSERQIDRMRGKSLSQLAQLLFGK